MLRPTLVTLASILALAVGQSSQRCFITNDWSSEQFVPGQPNVLIWEFGGVNRDILLDNGTGIDSQFLGVIARNVSQGSVFWIPPRDIAQGNYDQEFEIQLWDLDNGNGCSSPSFKFAKIDDDAEPTTTAFYGPFVTTAISIIDTGYVTATATVATYQSDQPQFEQAMTGSITGTDGAPTDDSATTSSTSAAASSATSTPNKDSQDSGPNVLAIAVGTVGGVLLVALIVMSVLLWRFRRRRASKRNSAKEESQLKPDEYSPVSTPHSQMSEVDARQIAMAEVSGDTARHEMTGDSHVQELPSRNMDPVELPAEEIPPPSYPGHENMEVSPLTGSSRRSSLSFDKGTFTVSPMRDRKE